MAKYGQLSPADYFRADAEGLAREYGLVVAWIAQAEMDDVPAKEFRKSLAKLRKIGLEFTLETVLGKVLSERIRKNRHRSKTKDLAKHEDVPADVTEDVPKDVTEDGTGNVASRSRSRTSSSSKKNAAPAAPRYALSKTACLQAWNDAVTEVTGEPSCVTGQGNQGKAQQFHRIVYDNADTFADVVRRRVKLGQSLNLHYCMNDYANDRQRCAPAKPSVTTAAPRAPEGGLRYLQHVAEGKV